MGRGILKSGAACCLAIGLAVVLPASGLADAGNPPDYRSLTFDPISWPEPEVKTFTADNGISFFLIEDHELPLIRARVMVRSGGFRVPREKTGLAEITGEVMRSGGTRKYPPDKLNTLLADKAAEIETGFGFISGSAGMSTLKDDFQDLLPVFVDLLRQPAFPEAKIALARQRLNTRIARRNDDQRSIAMRTYQRLIYGRDSIHAREPEYRTVERIRRKDLVQFHKRAYVGANLLVGVVGDFEVETLRPRLESAFSRFPAGKRIEVTLPEPDNPRASSLNVVGKSDVNQSLILMGHLGGKRQNPDYAALKVMEKILSGGFSGRLFETIRTEMGLAYSVFGQYGCHFFYPGMFFVGLSTRTDATADAVEAVKAEIERIQKEAGKKELKQARDQFFNSLVFRFDPVEKILERRMRYAYQGMAADTFQQLIRDIRQVAVADVVRVAREYLNPDSLTTLAVGETEKLVDQLNSLGQVEVLPQP